MKLRHYAQTDVGRTRDHNEDSFGVGDQAQIERFGTLVVVCDGMGGHAAGEVASNMAVEIIISDYYANSDPNRSEALVHAFGVANERVHRNGHGNMGTTGVAALCYLDTLYIANVGDSRAYLLRDGALRQITTDHSLVSEQVAAGVITPQQARTSPYRNVITRALGHQTEVQVDIFRQALQLDDIIILCSDGLHGVADDHEIIEIIGSQSLEQASKQLIDLANQRGGPDNITIAIIQVDALDQEEPVLADDSAAPGKITAVLPSQEATSKLQALQSETHIAKADLPKEPATPLELPLTILGGVLASLLLISLLVAIFLVLPSQPPTNPNSNAPLPTVITPQP